MGKILRNMTAEEQAFYDEDSKKFPRREIEESMKCICLYKLLFICL